jgi:hypothetical protein
MEMGSIKNYLPLWNKRQKLYCCSCRYMASLWSNFVLATIISINTGPYFEKLSFSSMKLSKNLLNLFQKSIENNEIFLFPSKNDFVKQFWQSARGLAFQSKDFSFSG